MQITQAGEERETTNSTRTHSKTWRVLNDKACLSSHWLCHPCIAVFGQLLFLEGYITLYAEYTPSESKSSTSAHSLTL